MKAFLGVIALQVISKVVFPVVMEVVSDIFSDPPKKGSKRKRKKLPSYNKKRR